MNTAETMGPLPAVGLRPRSGQRELSGEAGTLERIGATPDSARPDRRPGRLPGLCPGRAGADSLPAVSRPLLGWFTWYCRGYIRRHFHAVRISVNGLPPDTTGCPLVVYSNHASWWDPLIGLLLMEECFRGRRMFAPIDAAMLRRYRVLSRLGFFGVEPRTRRGAIQFLRTSQAILHHPDHVLAVTPQGRFADVRERPLRFQPGLGVLAAQVSRALFLPIGVEYSYWEERLPEVLIRFGEPLLLEGVRRDRGSPDALSAVLERRLESTLDPLALEAQRREPSDFRTILRGGTGQGGLYDLWRAARAALCGETFARQHGVK